jgi:hypothetical protein
MKETELNELKTMVSNATTNSEKLNIPNLTTGNEKIQQVAREQAVGAVSIGEEEKHFERKLQKFVDILEPNPRAMKRLINDVSTAKAMTYLYNQAVQTDQLILWTILKLQHPLLADYFWEHADKLSEIESFNGADQAITGESEFDRLLLKSSTRNLFRFSEGQHEIVLDKEFINNMRFVKADPVQVKTKLL